MPKEGQRTITVPEWIWELAEKHFKENRDELAKQGIKSVTALIKLWIVEKSR